MTPLKNARHEAFAQARVAGMSILDAYEEAGYKAGARSARSNASQLNAKTNIQERITELQAEAAKQAVVTGADIINETARIGLSDIRDLFDEDGNMLPVHKLPDAIAKAVSSIKVTTKPQPDENGNIEVIATTEVKLWDKNSALEKLFKHFKLFEAEEDRTDPAKALLAAIMQRAKPLAVAT